MSAVHPVAAHHTASAPSGVEFLSPPHRSERCKALAKLGCLVARVAPVVSTREDGDPGSERTSWSAGPLQRGRLREAIDGAVEISLALRGALPPSVEMEADLSAVAEDQLFRVRALGVPGICLVLPELSSLADDDGLLHPNDSQALVVWHELSDSDPVLMLLDEHDRAIKWLAPQSLGAALGIPVGWRDEHADATRESRHDIASSTNQRDAVTEEEIGSPAADMALSHQQWHHNVHKRIQWIQNFSGSLQDVAFSGQQIVNSRM